jgi:acyl carrier protein
VTDVGVSHAKSSSVAITHTYVVDQNLLMQATQPLALQLKILPSFSVLIIPRCYSLITLTYFPKMMFQKTLVAALLVASASAFAPQTPAFVTRRAAPASALFMSAELEGKVKEIIVSQLGVDADKVVNSATFVDDLGADSLDTVELIMAIEEEFDCEIPEEEAANISTVQEVIDFVLKL